MQETPLSRGEIADIVARQIARLTSMGVARDEALRAVATGHGVRPERLAWFVDAFGPSVNDINKEQAA